MSISRREFMRISRAFGTKAALFAAAGAVTTGGLSQFAMTPPQKMTFARLTAALAGLASKNIMMKKAMKVAPRITPEIKPTTA